MAKYRKKPVVIEAVEWRGDYVTRLDWPSWFDLAVGTGAVLPHPNGTLQIATLEGDMIASKGDYIIKGIKGELYPLQAGHFRCNLRRTGAATTPQQRLRLSRSVSMMR